MINLGNYLFKAMKFRLTTAKRCVVYPVTTSALRQSKSLNDLTMQQKRICETISRSDIFQRRADMGNRY